MGERIAFFFLLLLLDGRFVLSIKMGRVRWSTHRAITGDCVLCWEMGLFIPDPFRYLIRDGLGGMGNGVFTRCGVLTDRRSVGFFSQSRAAQQAWLFMVRSHSHPVFSTVAFLYIVGGDCRIPSPLALPNPLVKMAHAGSAVDWRSDRQVSVGILRTHEIQKEN